MNPRSSTPGSPPTEVDQRLLEAAQRLIANVESVVYGKREAVTLATVGLLAGGHVLLEDVPGTGKTTLARALARSIGAEFRRVQFTSDLLPSDVLGTVVYAADTGKFRFRAGPIFANVVLADELNRTTPRTQSALLECMAERQISVEGKARQLPDPFFVIATQNPLEFEGTYPLPESQLDRFLLRISMGYPDRDDERRMLASQARSEPIDALVAVVDPQTASALVRAARAVHVQEDVTEYVLSIVAATRTSGRFVHGASPRASLGLTRAARALALCEGRDYVLPDDVRRLAVPVIAHRLVPSAQAGHRGDPADPGELLRELLDEVPAPA